MEIELGILLRVMENVERKPANIRRAHGQNFFNVVRLFRGKFPVKKPELATSDDLTNVRGE